MGLVPLDSRRRSDLLEALDNRVGSGATIVAGQMPINEWHGDISDPALADAILDRLIHSSQDLATQPDGAYSRLSLARAFFSLFER